MLRVRCASHTNEFKCKNAFTQLYKCPHSVVTRIGSVTRDQKVPVRILCGLVAAVWTYTSGA